MQMSAVVPVKCCIGIETEVLRHNIAVQFNRTLMLSMPDINMPVMFIHADINTFTSLNSITKLYMYDAVYTPSLLEKIKCIFYTGAGSGFSGANRVGPAPQHW